MNGLDAVAATWTRALGKLTCRSDLQSLTMFTWADVLSSRGLLRRSRAWCPSCYEEDAEPYEHLLWCFEPVQVCPYHDRRLQSRCPHCGQGLPVISWRSVPGFCSSCSGWLGLSSSERSTLDNTAPINTPTWDRQVAENLGELLAKAPTVKNPPGRDRIAWSLVALTGLPGARAMARKLDLDYVTAWTWSTGGVRLLVARLLLICAKLGVSVTEFLTSDTFAPSSTDARNPLVPAAPAYAYNTVKRQRRPSAALLKHAEAHLQRAISVEPSPPPTLETVCCEGGLTFPYAHRHFPDLCCALSSRWKAWRHADGVKRRELLANEVRDVAARLHGEGIDPTNFRVARALSKPGAIRDIAVRTALREIRQHLGLESSER